MEEKNEIISENRPFLTNKKIIASTLVLAMILSIFFGTVFGFIAGSASQRTGGKLSQLFKPSSDSEVVKQKIVAEDSAIIDVVNKTSPAVVSIIISKDVPKMRNFFSDPFGFFDPFGSNPDSQGGTQKQQIGGGSGFLVSADGMVVTNKHVVSDASAEYTVITNDGKEHSAKVLARDPVNDIAVIKIDGQNYPTLNFGDSGGLQIGQTVVAIGNSLGEFTNTVSRGIISGLRRSLTAGSGLGETERLNNIIQTDAAINPGNSGGPLIDINGDVIGINVAMARGAQNIGFAIPANQIKKVVDQIKTTGKISAPYIGVRYMPVTDSIQKSNNLPYNYGALVARGSQISDLAVVPGSPADKAGIQENDIILELNGSKIDDNNTLSDLISQRNVGDTITLKVWHKGNVNDVKITLEERK
ncbi:MAG TPA: trypsin-like peptidase domain-containing protein [Patescibacteria group bacterium]|nr:trypsin-like peptidase domain-containing protein [Patescibacteria group bacterium]